MKCDAFACGCCRLLSPSMRREWIEIFLGSGLFPNLWSPSMRREWIEMSPYGVETVSLEPSPSMRREWIEMQLVYSCRRWFCVSLHAEGVD